MKNRILFDNIVKKYKIDFTTDGNQAFANVGRILYTMTEKEFEKFQEETK